MANGYTGKILRVNLTTKEISSLDTAKYEEFGGGYGMGAAIFWELSVAPGQSDLRDPYDPRNVLPLMAGPSGGHRRTGGRAHQRMRHLSGDVSHLRVPTRQLRRPLRHHAEGGWLGWGGGGRQGRQAGVDQHHQRQSRC